MNSWISTIRYAQCTKFRVEYSTLKPSFHEHRRRPRNKLCSYTSIRSIPIACEKLILYLDWIITFDSCQTFEPMISCACLSLLWSGFLHLSSVASSSCETSTHSPSQSAFVQTLDSVQRLNRIWSTKFTKLKFWNIIEKQPSIPWLTLWRRQP